METLADLSRMIAPEDLSAGDYVAVARQTYEFVTCADDAWSEPRTHRVSLTPPDAGHPWRVVRVCLPFILVKGPDGGYATLDARRHRLLKLTDDYGSKAFKCLERSGSASRKRGSRA